VTLNDSNVDGDNALTTFTPLAMYKINYLVATYNSVPGVANGRLTRMAIQYLATNGFSGFRIFGSEHNAYPGHVVAIVIGA